MSVNLSEAINKTKKEVEITEDNIDKFVEIGFQNMVEVYETESDNFQGLGAVSGDMFERLVQAILTELYDVTVERQYDIEKADMEGQSAADLVILRDGVLIGVIEVKGSPREYKDKSGKVIRTPSAPGLKRSDTVKKAVCQAYEFKHSYPDIPFFIVTNIMPSKGSSSFSTLSKAEGDIIDKVVDVTDWDDLEEMMEEMRD